MTEANRLWIGFSEGVVWAITKDEEQARDWLDRGVVECIAPFDQASDLIFGVAQ